MPCCSSARGVSRCETSPRLSVGGTATPTTSFLSPMPSAWSRSSPTPSSTSGQARATSARSGSPRRSSRRFSTPGTAERPPVPRRRAEAGVVSGAGWAGRRAAVTDVAERTLELAERAVHDYAPGEERPLLSHTLLVGLYGTAVTGLTFLVRRRRKPLPERIPATDLALLSVATHKLSRILTKDTVTAPFRAPFARFKESAGSGEINEEPRDEGDG